MTASWRLLRHTLKGQDETIVNHHDEEICVIRPFMSKKKKRTKRDAEADGFMLAAAPDLYEALKNANEMLEGLGVFSGRINAALRKAEGR